MTTKPKYQSQEEFQNRSRKLAELKSLGIDCYPHKYTPSDTAQELIQQYQEHSIGHSEDALAEKTPLVSIAGRLVLMRSMGKNCFAQIQDETGRIQVMFNRDFTELQGFQPTLTFVGAEIISPYRLLEKKVDLGDILGVEGYLFHTNKGEMTILVKKATILCKTLLPLADKHSGLADKELRYRKRWLDLISNLDVRKTFRTRSKILHFIRQYLEKENFIEVETPVLQSAYGGAEARPFVTTLNALEQEMFLRISLEIPLKKLIIGGMGRVFEIGKVFRNEGIDRNHNPEFTLLEAYAPYWDYHDMMHLVENLFEKLALELHGSTHVAATNPENGEVTLLNFKAPWPRISMIDAIKKYGALEPEKLSDTEMRKLLMESGHVDQKKLEAMSRGLLIAALFSVFVEHHLIQPHHIIDHPIETTPLCKLHRNPEDRAKGIVERFESFVMGQEICNAYSELNDPELQRQLLEQQAGRRDSGDEEAPPLDEEFIEAICQGMPPTGGLGIGLDRMIMLMTNSHSIRDVLFFPWMKPQETIVAAEEQ